MIEFRIRPCVLAGLVLAIVPGCTRMRRPDGGGQAPPPLELSGGAAGPAAGPPIPAPPAPLEPHWVHPKSLADTHSMDGNDSDSGSVAAAANGDALIAVEYGSRLFLSQRVGGTWSHPVRNVTPPHNPAGGSLFTPRPALHANGDAVVVWTQRDNGTDRIYASTRRGGVWVDPRDHADHLSPAGGNAQQPRVVIDPLGTAIVVWEQYVAGNGRIFKSEYRNGVWTNPTSTGDGISAGATHAQDAAIAVGPDGHVIVAWSQWGISNYSVFVSERINGLWMHPANLAAGISPAGTHAMSPRVAFDGAGDAVLAWVQSDGSDAQVFVSEYRAGVWRHPTGLADNVSPDGTAVHEMQVAMSQDRQAVIVWAQDVSASLQSLFKSEYRNAAWTHPAGLGDHFGVGRFVNELVVAMDAHGNVVVPFTAADAANQWVTCLSERRAGVWIHPPALSAHISPGTTVTTQPAIAVDGNDAVTVIWRQSDGTFQKTYVSEYR